MSSSIATIAGSSKLPSKPIQPTQYWTYENALSLIKFCQDPYLSDALNEFLLLNKDVILSPEPFEIKNKSITIKTDTKEISIRGILFTDLTSKMIENGELISSKLNLDVKEVIRVISQTCKKIPPKSKHKLNIKSKLDDERHHDFENENLNLYILNVLRERRIILKIASELASNKTNQYASSIIRNLGKEIFLSGNYLNSLLNSIKNTSVSMVNGSYITGLSDRIDETIFKELALFFIESLKLLIELSMQNPLVTKNMLKEWFEFLQASKFGIAVGSPLLHQEAYDLIQALITIITVELLDLENTSNSDDDDGPDKFMNDIEIFTFINKICTSDYNNNSVITFSWSILLLRKSYFLSEYPDSESSKNFQTKFDITSINETINQLNKKSLNFDVFGLLKKINNILKYDPLYSAILSTVITSSVALLELTPEITSTILDVIRNCPNNIVENFFSNEATIDTFIIARAKFPLLLSPYIKLASINGNFALHEFNDLRSYIQNYKKDYFDQLYHLDEQDPELIQITSEINIYPPFESNKKLAMALTSGTKAKLLPAANSDEVLVTFLYQYNGWAFLGRVLQNLSKNLNNVDVLREEIIVDILNLMNNVAKDNGEEEIKLMLESMSAYTDESDIMEIIFSFLEQALHLRNVTISTATINILTTLIPIVSNRIWPFLTKSALFSKDGKEGLAALIFGSVEMVNGDYKFSASLINFANALVEESISINYNYPFNTKSEILHKISSHLIFLFENIFYSRFNHFHQKLQMSVSLIDFFTTILTTVYGVQNGLSSENKVTSVFINSSKQIFDSFTASTRNSARAILPLLYVIEAVAQNLNAMELSDNTGIWTYKYIESTFSFSKLIIELRNNMKVKPSALEQELFTNSLQLVQIFANIESYGAFSLDLLTSLIDADWLNETAPSLLSYLGNDGAKILQNSLANGLDNTFDDYDMKVSLYNFICAVMRSSQEGLIVLFNTGKGAFNIESKEPKLSLIQILKKNVREIKYYPNSVSIHLIDAIALSCNSWTTVKETKFDEDFVELLLDRTKLQIKESPKSIEGYISRCYEVTLASKIADILALYLFTTKNEKCKKKINEFLNSKEFIEVVENKFEIHNYHPFLQNELESSFEAAYPTSNLADFVTSLHERDKVSIDAIYNLKLMDKLFKSSDSWDEIKERIIASSINDQYLTAQLNGVHSFKALLTSFCTRFEGKLIDEYLTFTNFLLNIDIEENIPTERFRSVFFERIDLGFYLIYSIYTRKPERHTTEALEILKNASTLLTSDGLNFAFELTSSNGTYRPLLRIIYCALKMIENSTVFGLTSLFENLFNIIVTKSIKVLSIELQNEIYLYKVNGFKELSKKVNEKYDDLLLVLSILKVFMQIQTSNPLLSSKIASSIKSFNSIKTLINMYMYSHPIELNEEFGFAQLSLTFLSEFMSIESVANDIINSGLYITLLESPISKPIRNGELSITDNNKYYKLWINGILPIIITSLYKLGATVAPEICVALQLFGKQISFCFNSWSNDSKSIQISTALLIETNQLIVIYDILKAMNIEEYLKTQQPNEILDSEDIDMRILPGIESESKRDDFIDCIDNLLKHPKFLTSRIIPSSHEEQIIIERGDEQYNNFVKRVFEEIRGLKTLLNE
ncbi:NUP188 [Candida pseudojiufengensis]|uniref:NUP188 n=1 Tax=Candida pseudojiufengensis TaxID=497109 RepID=UPI0022246644|nr:NUP188 [Candida pseudojiufengensis]KAI5963511.1 NUP188 [Candida pseudojiufengensis]